MEITLDALSLGKPTVIKDKQYCCTDDYTQWFIKEMSKYTNRFIVKVQLPSQVTLSKETKDITYNKVWIQAILPDKFNIKGYNEVIGLVYALDVRVPIYKVYRAYLHPETHNTVIFDKNWIESYELKPNKNIEVSLENLMQKVSNLESKLDTLRGTYISEDSKYIYELLGRFIDRAIMYDYKYVGGKVKISTNNIINAYQNTFSDLTKPINWLLLYDNICNEINDNKDITNIFEKTILVGMLFDLVN